MNVFQGQSMVIGCLAASGAVAAGNAIVEGHAPTFKQLVGFGFVSIGLATVAMFEPELAAGFSALILTSAVFVYGLPIFNAVSAITPTSSTTSTPAPAVVSI